MENILTETLDKYRVELNKPTTGGVKGYSVRVIGKDKAQVIKEAFELATEVELAQQKEGE